MAILFMMFLVGLFGHLVTYKRMQTFWKAYLDEREAHRSSLLNFRAFYEEANRHMKKHGLGELSAPEKLDQAIEQMIDDEVNVDVDFILGSVKFSRRTR